MRPVPRLSHHEVVVVVVVDLAAVHHVAEVVAPAVKADPQEGTFRPVHTKIQARKNKGPQDKSCGPYFLKIHQSYFFCSPAGACSAGAAGACSAGAAGACSAGGGGAGCSFFWQAVKPIIPTMARVNSINNPFFICSFTPFLCLNFFFISLLLNNIFVYSDYIISLLTMGSHY